VREDAGLSLLTTIGTVGLTGTVLEMSVAAPVLLPCSVLPAIALRYAYGASAAKHEERRRSARVLEYSRVLASGPTRDVALGAFLHMVHSEFDAAESLVVFEDGRGLLLDGSSTHPRPVMRADYPRLDEDPGPRILDGADLPSHWTSAIATPLVVERCRIGMAVVAKVGARFQPRDLTALNSLVGSLSVAVQNADHMVRVAEEASKFRGIVEQASDGIVVTGREGVIEVWSPAMTLLTGVSATEALGVELRHVITAEDEKGQPIDPFGTGESQLSEERPQCTVDVEVVRTDGERRAARLAHAGVFEAGALVRDVVIVRDITAERQVDRMKDDFIATVSHELRTPLTPIKGYAGMLRKRGDAMPAEKRDRALDVIVERADHLGRLVEDLLTASTITSNREPKHALAAEHADLGSLVARACDNFPGYAERVHLAPADPPVSVLCDPTRVIQITSNLVSNALKYSPSDRPVYVVIDHVDGCGRVTVTDHGQGIPADQTERIFEKFHRVEDPMVMSTSGTGLGLFIARQLARAMRGELTAESTLGVGSRFTLLLPASET
jgi:PAS domain S-box-containing protein